MAGYGPCQAALTDRQWLQMRRVVPAPKPGGRTAKHDRREIAIALLCITRVGCQWRCRPRTCTPGGSCTETSCDGRGRAFDRLHDVLWVAEGRRRRTSAASIDSQTMRTTERRRPHGYDAGQGINGRMRHVLVDALGLTILIVVHPADVQDRDGAKPVLEPSRHRFSRLGCA